MARNVVFTEGTVITGRPQSGSVTSWAAASNVEYPDAIGAWDRVYLGGLALPGIAVVRGSAKRRTDRKRSSGVNGARVTHLGWDASELKITVRIWTAEQLDALQPMIGNLKPKSGKAPKPVDVYHPALALLGVHTVEVLEVTLPERVGPDQFETTISCIEFVPSSKKSKVTTPKAAEPSLTDFKTAIQRPPAPSADGGVTGP